MPRHPDSQTPLKATAASRPASPPDSNQRWNLVLAPIIRDVLYAPDGVPPEGWTLAQDLRICKRVVAIKTDGVRLLEPAIRGLRVLYPKGKLTLKLLMADKDGSLLRRSSAAYWDSLKRKSVANSLGSILREIAGR